MTHRNSKKQTKPQVSARATFHLGAVKEALDQLVASGHLKPGEVPTFRMVDPTPDLEEISTEDLEET